MPKQYITLNVRRTLLKRTLDNLQWCAEMLEGAIEGLDGQKYSARAMRSNEKAHACLVEDIAALSTPLYV